MTSTSLIRLGRILADNKGIRLSTLGKKVANHGLFFARLEGGHTITEARKYRIFQYLSDHWPEDLDWPPDIPRPEPSADANGKAA